MTRYIQFGKEGEPMQTMAVTPFVGGFVEAMFFTNTGTPDDAENGLEDAGIDELSQNAWAFIIDFCTIYQMHMDGLLNVAYSDTNYTQEQAGRDLWFTVNGHGVGYWDRKALDVEISPPNDVSFNLGAALTTACGDGELYLFRNDATGEIEIEGYGDVYKERKPT